MLKHQIHALSASTSGEFRTETLLGKEYLVVPVVAMVEGVRFGANQSSAELGLAEDFGKYVDSWANKPLVMNHPKVDGNFVSANSASVLEDWSFGITMNPILEGDKLKLEAWIDVTRSTDLGGEFSQVVDLLKADTVLEVSVGFFCDVENKSGSFKGQSYSGVWKNIVPDHLAILSEGVKGACSVEDGCGVPRINKDGSMPAPNCQCGEKTDCSCNKSPEAKINKTSVPQVPKSKVLTVEQVNNERKEVRSINELIYAQSIAPDVINQDVMTLLRKAAEDKFGPFVYVYGFTQSVAIFEIYDSESYTYKIMQCDINVTETSAEFVGEPTEVVLLTKIVPVTSDNTGTVNTQETTMTVEDDKTKNQPDNSNQADQPVEVQANKQPVAQTAAEYIAAAPAGIREVLETSMKAHEAKRTSLIANIKASKRNTFGDEFLQAQTVEVLEGIVALAAPDYSGQAPATTQRVQSDDKVVPMAPKAFERKAS
jgi:hypothetical protein